MLATNGSPACRRATVRAGRLFQHTRLLAAVVLPEGVDVNDDAATMHGSAVRRALADAHLHAAAETLAEVCDVLGPRARAVILDGDPAAALIGLARSEAADAIVVGSLHKARDRTLTRTMSDDLVAGAPCPVIELGR
ncbi:universal stress protein [Salinilacustrithrix flava]|uniref:universal stress protein n=1 Tax=Salinilacustrithrix flava TaxID=2957203 RepID=UPI003D7C28B0